MTQEIEIEFKNLLTKEEYDLILNDYFTDLLDFYTQKNVYYDTASYELKGAKCALRIRLKDNMAEFTLKSPHEGHHKELNIPLSQKEAEDLISSQSISIPIQISAFLKADYQLDIDHVLKIAELTTKRIEKDYKECLIVLDKSWYSNTVDYELEVEAPSIALGKEVFSSILNQYDIPERETLNKIARARNAIKDVE
ncbi:CYTH domain-containing protein [Alkalibacterium olivapovliticus]|uniref:Uncharacterized protein YjbK n=1 Tax=Alkalibacterium olivapovliticus TaxID=99907 RepID=A0A2T0WBA2_9LACT|nr:CYTH domain-containing protein [Alkalibacterium olivapovliticus]PRY83985.1 uncharacterized protein YjbK [Alkalibacterium olivapovliticus]